MRALALAMLGATAAHAAPADPLASETIVFARAGTLYKADAKGRGEVELAKVIPPNGEVRALRSDAAGKALLVDISGAWSWMPLAGGKSLTKLPCAKGGPAQLSQDGTEVVCRSPTAWAESIVVELATGKSTQVPVGSRGTRIVGRGADRRIVWADPRGVWSAPPGKLDDKNQVAPTAPWSEFLPNEDGSRAVGVYTESSRQSKAVPQTDQLVGFALDGVGARRKGVPHGIPLEWSHDGAWLLVQDGDSACIVRALGGQYKCWKGFRGASLAPDGSFALLIGATPPAKGAPPPPAPPPLPVTGDDDLPLPPITQTLPLWRAVLAGPSSAPPTQVTAAVDGAAVWLGR